jgi:predicted secreted protein
MSPFVAPWLRTTSAFCMVLAVLPASAEAPPAVAANQLTLSATAGIDVTRDLLAITFSTQREGTDAAAVQSQLAQALEPALAEARKIARPGQVEVSSGNFAVFPRYAPKGGATTWQGSAELRVEGRDVDSITRLVGRIQSMSVARVGYSLSREARDKVQGEVSALAIARFRSQAEAYAKAFGFSAITLRAVELSTNESSIPPMPMFRAAAAAPPMAGEALPVEAGKASVTATVSGSVQMK